MNLVVTANEGYIFTGGSTDPLPEITSGTATLGSVMTSHSRVYTFPYNNITSDVEISVPGTAETVYPISRSSGPVSLRDINDSVTTATNVEFSNDADSQWNTSFYLNGTMTDSIPLTAPPVAPSTPAPAPQKPVKIKTTNFAATTLKNWDAVKNAMKELQKPQLVEDEQALPETPVLAVDIQGTNMVVAKDALDFFAKENKGLHVHIGNGFAVTFFGQNMSENQNVCLDYTMSDKKTDAGGELAINFTKSATLNMNVLLHAYLADSTVNGMASIYTKMLPATEHFTPKYPSPPLTGFAGILTPYRNM